MAKTFVKKVKKVLSPAAWRASEGARGSPRLRLVGGACRPRRCDHKREVAFGKFSRRWVSPLLVGYGGRELERFLKELKIVGMRVQGAKVNSLREERGDLGQGGWGGKQRTWGGGVKISGRYGVSKVPR